MSGVSEWTGVRRDAMRRRTSALSVGVASLCVSIQLTVVLRSCIGMSGRHDRRVVWLLLLLDVHDGDGKRR